MLVIRLSRVGKKNHAQYKVVLAEKTYPVKGKFIELLGSYDPHLKQAMLKGERIKHWLAQGATCSDSVHNLLVSEKVIDDEKRKINITKKKKKEDKEETGEDKEDKKEEAKPKEDEAEKSATEKEPAAEKQEKVVETKEKPAEPKEETNKQNTAKMDKKDTAKEEEKK